MVISRDQPVATNLQFLSNTTLDTLNGCLRGELDPLELPSGAIVKCEEIGCETES